MYIYIYIYISNKCIPNTILMACLKGWSRKYKKRTNIGRTFNEIFHQQLKEIALY